MAQRNFLILCVLRSEERVARVGGYYEDLDTWHEFSEDEVLRLMRRAGTTFFTAGADGAFAEVHTVHRRNEFFLQTNPDGSLSDNLAHLNSCGNLVGNFEDLVAERLAQKETLRRFRDWLSDRHRT